MSLLFALKMRWLSFWRLFSFLRHLKAQSEAVSVKVDYVRFATGAHQAHKWLNLRGLTEVLELIIKLLPTTVARVAPEVFPYRIVVDGAFYSYDRVGKH